jgi:hypothetical protein
MAPFSIDLPSSDGATPAPGNEGNRPTLTGILAVALTWLLEAVSAGREGRRHDRATALGEAMRILDGLVSEPPLPFMDARGYQVTGHVLRIMQLLLQATLTGREAPLGLATEALRSVYESGKSPHAAVVDAR